MVAAAAIGWLVTASVYVPESSASESAGCSVQLAQTRSDEQNRSDQEATRPRSAERPRPNPPPAAAAEALRAPQEKELAELARLLKAMSDEKTAPAVLADLRGGKPFSLERFGVLVADVRSIVVLLDARELRARLGGNKEVSAETKQGIDQRVRVMETCAPGRFANRGGPAVLEQVTSLVQKHRAQLVPSLFLNAAPQDAPDGAPPTQRKQGN